ncbi:palmitoyltransferase for Vac8p [Mycoemilia scoparia]|uniref:Palmitoyltransferase for Vac8p n=1 Tax=Mycoemilia scoparia TaxID=417184 RepID=A0A9W8DXI3_9FUNG|nr:palmitoyltransferase for Vac8p [Mycoemilia scoparia]
MQSTTYASNEGFNVVVPDTLGSPHSSNSNHNSESDNAGGDDDDDDSDEDSDLGPGFENEPDTFRCYTIYEEFSFQLLIACLIGGIFGITLVLFSCYHAYLISTNTTTLEGMQAFTYRYGQYPNIQFSSSSESVNIFNVGISKNWRQVLGPLWYLWLVPIDQPTTDGAHFPINENVYRKLFFE